MPALDLMPARGLNAGMVGHLRWGVLALAACGGGGPTIEADADIGVPEFTVSNTDDSGVLHSVTFRCVELAAITPQVFVSDGPHAHTLRLEVAQMQSILLGEVVDLVFTDGHEHSFSIQKPDDACIGLANGN